MEDCLREKEISFTIAQNWFGQNGIVGRTKAPIQ